MVLSDILLKCGAPGDSAWTSRAGAFGLQRWGRERRRAHWKLGTEEGV